MELRVIANILDESISLLNSGGIFVSDNILYKGMIAADELVVMEKTIVSRMREYLQYM